MSARILPFPERTTKTPVSGDLTAEEAAALCGALHTLEIVCGTMTHPIAGYIGGYAAEVYGQIDEVYGRVC